MGQMGTMFRMRVGMEWGQHWGHHWGGDRDGMGMQ